MAIPEFNLPLLTVAFCVQSTSRVHFVYKVRCWFVDYRNNQRGCIIYNLRNAATPLPNRCLESSIADSMTNGPYLLHNHLIRVNPLTSSP